MKRLIRFFRTLRGKLILTYTLVTVLALLVLEMLVIGLGYIPISQLSTNQASYFSDVVYVLYPQARIYLQPGAEDLAGLQAWLSGIYRSGYASLPPRNLGESPAAPIDRSDPMVVLSPDGVVLAQAPASANNLVGQRYIPPQVPGSQNILEFALQKNFAISGLYVNKPDGNYLVAVPITAAGRDSQLVGVIMVSIQPPPVILATRLKQAYEDLFLLAGTVALTAVLLLLAVAPFAALFGFIMSRGLTRRLKALTLAADAWSEGNFSVKPDDRSRDEIGILGQQMRHMAERVQTLLQSQQELATMEERNRLARDLHDTVKQQTFATLMQVRAAKNTLNQDAESARQHLDEAEGLLKTSQQELGFMIAELHPAALEGQGLAAALRENLERWSEQTRIPVDYQVQNERRLPLEIEQSLYRVAQEALSNVARHSQASSLTVRLVFDAQQVCLSISDNGKGFDPAGVVHKGFGLQSMRERVMALGGQWSLDSSVESGTTITAAVPAR
ncbi:MAG: histidine kinase [Anaerolineaceae bacterium]|nr:histidine kinase [Anaerolineaceae bacterium]